MADPVYPIYPAQEETAAVQKYLADKRAYDALAAQLPAIERKIAAQQKIAETGMASRPGFATEDIFGLARPVYNADQQWKAVQAIRGLEASKAEIQNAPKPDLGAVESAIRSTTPPELPPGVQEIVDGGTQKPQATVAPSAPAQPAPAPEKPQYDPFEQFRRVDEMRRGFFGAAVSKLNELPQQYRAKALRAAKDYWEMTGPKLPPNALLPVQNPLTGDMIQGMAMTPEGKIVEIPGTSQELPKELSPIATKRAEAISYADQSLAQLDNLLGKLKDPKISDNDKIIAGKDFLPAYTRIQSQGPNVLGVDEAKRTGQALETEYGNLLNIFNEKQVIGTDLPRFIKQLESTKSTIQSARKQELETLRRLSPKTASYFDTVDTRERQQQSAPGGVVKAVRMPGGSLTRQ